MDDGQVRKNISSETHSVEGGTNGDAMIEVVITVATPGGGILRS